MRRGLKPLQNTRPPLRRRALALGATILAHVAVIGGLLWLHLAPPHAVATMTAITVRILPRPPAPPSPRPEPAAPALVQVPLPRLVPPVVTIAPSANVSDLMSAGQLAGAASPGGGGNGCAMAQTVQQALRRDPLVAAAVQNADRMGKAIMLWDGDWVRTGNQEGKGLSAVREAIAFAVAFAPPACRDEPMHGLVLLSLADGTTRFGIGAGTWRWSDLLGVR